MKRAASILAFAVAGFIIGCQDNTLTDPTGAIPTSHGRLNRNGPGNIILPMPSLPLNAILHEPGNTFNSFVQISGAVTYQATVVPLDPPPPNPQYAVSLSLTTDAEVRPYQPGGPSMQPVWHVSGTSDNWTPIPEDGIAFLTKRYQIDGRSDHILLNVRFRITLVSIELSSMWLELPPPGHGADGD